MADPVAYTKQGFPLKTCTRCNGSGKHSFNMIDGDKCYGCHGSGLQSWDKKTANARNAYIEAQQKARDTRGDCLKPGDTIRRNKQSRTIATITPSTGEKGATCPGWYLAVTYTDGTSEEIHTHECATRIAYIDPAPYIKAAQPFPPKPQTIPTEVQEAI